MALEENKKQEWQENEDLKVRKMPAVEQFCS